MSEALAWAALLQPLGKLAGIAAVQAKALARALGQNRATEERVLDLLFHLPGEILARVPFDPATSAHGDLVTADVLVERHERIGRGGRTIRARAISGETPIAIPMFGLREDHVVRRLPPGALRRISGRLTLNEFGRSIANPDFIDPPDTIPAFERKWPLTHGLSPTVMAKAMRAALMLLPPLPEWQDPALLRREQWPGFEAALRAIQDPNAPSPPNGAWRRLAYDEVLAGQLALALVRRSARLKPGRALLGDGVLRAKALAAFGHPPTPSQRQVLAEIDADLAAPHRMLRLLQGDVGSGKTLVALLAMLRAVEAGAQAALMAPTELLARQHMRTLGRLCIPAGVDVQLLCGSVKGAERKRVLAGLAEGGLKIVVGTHALFQEGVVFRNLGLAVVDEQHRFGVAQRLLLADKSADDDRPADMLVMTATPIPRTLLLTQWGEMAVSRLEGKPAGRQPVTTTLHGLRQLPEVVAAIARALDAGARIYWVCPNVVESELLDTAAAETRFAELAAHFPGNVGLAHGRQETDQRETALRSFAAGRTRVLVATTVIEVGVDVPEASVMVVEHAERFGLAQLHQLRGRVGRGAAQSFCMLLYDEALPNVARERLVLLRDTEDGFAIADADFQQRGGGELLGTRQSGSAVYRLGLADGEAQAGLVQMAHGDAELLLERDPELSGERGVAARGLLTLFGKEAAAERLRAG